MKILYLDCTSGISGDMTLGALLDLGIKEEFLIEELSGLGVDGYEIVVQKKSRHGIIMTDVDVRISDAFLRNHHEMRNLNTITGIIDASGIDEKAQKISKKIFREIAVAEAKVHGKSLDKVYFHEVGAIDSIVDIVGVAICIAALNPDEIYASPLHDGHGFIQCRHGMLPVPVPAVSAMLEGTGIPMVQEDIDTEMITPTGMGIVKCLAKDFVRMPPMAIERVGYGLGKRETGAFGAVRAFLGEN